MSDALDLFTESDPVLTLGDAAAALQLSKSGTHALLSTLVDIGLLERTDNSRYRLGWRLLVLGRQVLHSAAYCHAAVPVMQSFAARWGDTMRLCVLERGMVVCAYRSGGTHAVSSSTGDGARVHPHASASGKVLLAELDPLEVCAMVEREGLAAFTSATCTSLADLLDELEQVRRTGFAVDTGENASGVHCVAAPIRRLHGGAIVALSISASPERFAENRRCYERLVVACAARIADRQAQMPGT